MAISITIPRLGWSMEEGIFLGWSKQDGETVRMGDPIFTLESGKAAQEIESLDEGILRIPPDAPQPGGTVKVGQLLGYLVEKGEALPGAAAPVTPAAVAAPVIGKQTPVTTHHKSDPPARERTPVSPRARRAARELAVDLTTLQPTGNGGRIRERDVRAASAAAKPAPPGRGVEITPLRRTIAAHMLHSLRNTAPVTITCRADATELVTLRNQFKTAAASGGGVIPSFNDIIVKLTAVALQRHPLLAARRDGERLFLPDAIHIGLAVDTEHGLLVPVLRDVSTLALTDLAHRSRDLIAATRERRVRPDELQGSVFTVTNLGGFGIEAFTPIINFPETAILGLGAIIREVVALEDGSLSSRRQLTLSLTFDHTIVDGAPAARFLQTLRLGIENPVVALLGGGPSPTCPAS